MEFIFSIDRDTSSALTLIACHVCSKQISRIQNYSTSIIYHVQRVQFSALFRHISSATFLEWRKAHLEPFSVLFKLNVELIYTNVICITSYQEMISSLLGCQCFWTELSFVSIFKTDSRQFKGQYTKNFSYRVMYTIFRKERLLQRKNKRISSFCANGGLSVYSAKI